VVKPLPLAMTSAWNLYRSLGKGAKFAWKLKYAPPGSDIGSTFRSSSVPSVSLTNA
jgi:hypothetical protein